MLTSFTDGKLSPREMEMPALGHLGNLCQSWKRMVKLSDFGSVSSHETLFPLVLV